VAGYPEKHFEAPNMETDMHYLKKKVEHGAEYITTQMFFNNDKFFEFEQCCRKNGITVPIIPGLKPITTKRQLTVLPHIFHIDIPSELSESIIACKKDEDVAKIGKEWLISQCKSLKAHGVPALHFYTMGRTHIMYEVVKGIM
jgi:methylenetetrahydrofolate reductase (NADPH)